MAEIAQYMYIHMRCVHHCIQISGEDSLTKAAYYYSEQISQLVDV